MSSLNRRSAERKYVQALGEGERIGKARARSKGVCRSDHIPGAQEDEPEGELIEAKSERLHGRKTGGTSRKLRNAGIFPGNGERCRVVERSIDRMLRIRDRRGGRLKDGVDEPRDAIGVFAIHERHPEARADDRAEAEEHELARPQSIEKLGVDDNAPTVWIGSEDE